MMNNYILSLELNIKNKYKKISNNKLVEYYIKDSLFYRYCNFVSFDGRQFGVVLNQSENNKELFLIRELNKDYFLLSRMDKNFNDKANSKKHFINLIPQKINDDKLNLLTCDDNKIKYFGKMNISTGELIKDKSYSLENVSGFNILIDNSTLGIKFEKTIYSENLILNQKYQICRILIPDYIEPLPINNVKNESNNKICILDSYSNLYRQNEKSIADYIKTNLKSLYNTSKRVPATDIYNPKKINLGLNSYISKYNKIIYYGHGYSSGQFLQIELDCLTDLAYDSHSPGVKDYLILIACNETKDNPISEYNSVLSLFKFGFKEILLTDSKVRVDDINRSSALLLALLSITNSISESILLLNRLSRSMVEVKSPFRLYKNPFLYFYD